MVWELWLRVILSVAAVYGDPISSVSIWPKSVFPIELGDSVSWLLTPKGGAEYNVDSVISFDVGGTRAYRIQKTHCTGPMEEYFTCTHKPQNEVAVVFTPKEELYGKDLVITYYKDMDALWANNAPIILREVIQLTKQPKYVNMKMELTEPSRYTHITPTGLRLEPPVFLTDSNVRIDCSSDGSLPPVPITFSIECPPPPTAVVEHDRVTQARQSLSYEKFFRTYGFRSPPTLSDLAPYVARKHASQLLRLGHVSDRKDNKTLRATLLITEKAHDCHVVCRLAGKESRQRLTVYHPTTISYLLPRPRDGYVQVGSEITCYADGHPPPMLSLRLTQPLRPPKPLTGTELDALHTSGRLPDTKEEDPLARELSLLSSGLDIIPQQLDPMNNAGNNGDSSIASSGTLQQAPHERRDGWFTGHSKEPYEDAKRIPGLGLSIVERHRQLGLLPNEYSIQGATFRLAPNATPGVELLLTCTARNVLPGDTTFLGMNGTMTRTRFVVAAVSYVSLAVSMGVCAVVLLILLIIIAAMLLQKRRQAQSDRPSANGTKKPKPYPGTQYNKGQPMQRPVPATERSNMLSGPPIPVNPYMTDPNYQYATAYNTPSRELPRATSLSHPDAQDLQYVELSFDQVPPGSVRIPGRGASMLRGGPTSASMTLYGTTPRSNEASRAYGSSVPQGLNITGGGPRSPNDMQSANAIPDETSSHYTEIVAFVQPKAHSSQLVLQQQQEATQALLAMHQNKPRVFV